MHRVLCVMVWLTPLLAGGQKSSCSPDELAVYRVFLDTHWSRELFPKQYPEWRPPAGWSKLVGRTHDSSYWLFREGERASAGLQVFAEKGHSDGLEAADQDGVYDEFTAPPVPRGEGRTMADFFLDGNHTLVSVVVRVVPSPDWFIGVDSLDLCRGNHWIDSIAIEVDPMDAGTDNGFTFTAPNWPSEPKEPVSRITSKRPSHPANSFYYPKLDKLPSIATLTFVKCRRRTAENATTAQCCPTSGDASQVSSTSTSKMTTVTSPVTTVTSASTTVTSATTILTSKTMTSVTSTAVPVTSSLHLSDSTETDNCNTSDCAVNTIRTKRQAPRASQGANESSIWATSSTSSGFTSQGAGSRTSISSPTQSTMGATGSSESTTPSQGRTPAQGISTEPSISSGFVSKDTLGSPTTSPATSPSLPYSPVKKLEEAAHRSAPRITLGASQTTANPHLCPAPEDIPTLTPTFAQTEIEDIDDLLEERVYHLSMELSRNASREKEKEAADGNDISNDLAPGTPYGSISPFDSTESVIRRTSKARRSKKGSRQAKNCQVSEWSAWSACSVSCGVGDATRTRRVLEHPRRGGRPCPALREQRWCGGHSECPQNFFNW